MGIQGFTSGEEPEQEESQSTYVTFKNPGHEEVDVSEGSEHRHKQGYFDAVQWFRDKLGQDINVPFGEFAVAARAAEEDGDPTQLKELFDQITE